METLRKAGFSEDQSRAQVKSMLCMYDGLKSEIIDLKSGLTSKFNSLTSKFNTPRSEVKMPADRSHESETVMIIGFIGVTAAIMMSG